MVLAVGVGLCGAGGVCLAETPAAQAVTLSEKLPLASAEACSAVMAELVKLGPAGVKGLCGRLAPAGDTNDSKARFALTGLGVHVGRDGAEGERKMFVGAILDALAAEKRPQVKGFLIRRIQVAGRDEAAAALGKLLLDDTLGEPAAQALLAIRTPTATVQFRRALAAAEGTKARLTMLKALGELRDRQSIPAILKATGDDDAVVRRTALFAAANIGDPAVAEAITTAMGAENAYERADATSAFLLLSRRLAGSGRADQAATMCRQLISTRTGEPHTRSAALHQLVSIAGPAAVGDLVAMATGDKNPQVRHAALRLATTLGGKGVTEKFAAALPKLPASAKVEVMGMLARRGDRAALPALRAAMDDADPAVQLAAIPAVAKVGGDEAVEPLLAAMNSTGPGERFTALQEALASVPGEEALAAAAGAIAKAPPPVRIALIDVLARRMATEHTELLFGIAGKDAEGAVRAAATKAIGIVAPAGAAGKVVQLVLTSRDSRQRAEAERAVTAICGRITDAAGRADPVLAALGRADTADRCSLLRILVRLPSPRGLAALQAAQGDEDASVRNAAIRTLAEWPDLPAAETLLKLATSAESPIHQVLALRGYIRLAGLGNVGPTEKLAMFDKAVAAAKRPDEKKLALGALGGVRSVAALQRVDPLLDDPALAAEAVAAAVKIVAPSGRNKKVLQGASVRATMEKVLRVTKDAGVRKQVKGILSKLPPARVPS